MKGPGPDQLNIWILMCRYLDPDTHSLHIRHIWIDLPYGTDFIGMLYYGLIQTPELDPEESGTVQFFNL